MCEPWYHTVDSEFVIFVDRLLSYLTGVLLYMSYSVY